MRILLALFLSLAAAPLFAEEAKSVGVDLQLVSEVAAVQPGVPFTVALHLRHHEGYHTYWKSPGIVGVPTSIEWSLPPGFAAGDIQWPAPELVDMATHPAHGFHREVLLLVAITPPAAITADSVTLTADLAWMACARDCNPGFATRALRLGVNRTPEARIDRTWAPKITAEQRQLPRPSKQWSVTIESPLGESPIRIRVKPTDKRAGDPADLYFFSEDGQISSEPPQVAERQDDGSYLITAARSDWGPENYDTLPGVLLASGSWAADESVRTIRVAPAYPSKGEKDSPPSP